MSIPTNSISAGNGKLTRKSTRNEFQIYIYSICMDIAIRTQIIFLSHILVFGIPVNLSVFLKISALFKKDQHSQFFNYLDVKPQQIDRYI